MLRLSVRLLATGALAFFGGCTSGFRGTPATALCGVAGEPQSAPEQRDSPTVDTIPPKSAVTLRLLLNIPAYRLDAIAGQELLASYWVAVGKPHYPTPTGDFAIRRIEWNPWWTPPEREWAKEEELTPPGPSNPMGRVKLYFRPLYFLHGTPFEHSLGGAASHGCVRLANADAIELARTVHRFGSPELSAVDVERLSGDTTESRSVPLSRPIPLRITYELAEVRYGMLWLYPDVYHLLTLAVRRDRAVAALVAAGWSEVGIDFPRLDSINSHAAVDPVAIPLDSLHPRKVAPRGVREQAPRSPADISRSVDPDRPGP